MFLLTGCFQHINHRVAAIESNASPLIYFAKVDPFLRNHFSLGKSDESLSKTKKSFELPLKLRLHITHCLFPSLSETRLVHSLQRTLAPVITPLRLSEKRTYLHLQQLKILIILMVDSSPDQLNNTTNSQKSEEGEWAVIICCRCLHQPLSC